MDLPEGGGHAIRPCLRIFRKGRPLLPCPHLELHFGVILGAWGGTIHIFVFVFIAKQGFFFLGSFLATGGRLSRLRTGGGRAHPRDRTVDFRGPGGGQQEGADRDQTKHTTRLVTPLGSADDGKHVFLRD